MADTSDIPEGEMNIQDLTQPSSAIQQAAEADLPGEVGEPGEVVPPPAADTPTVVVNPPPPVVTDEMLNELGTRISDMIGGHELVVRLLTPIFDPSRIETPTVSIARNLAKIAVNHSREVCVTNIQNRIREITNEERG